MATVDGDDSLHKSDEIILNDSDGVKAVMRLHRLVSEGTDKCPRPVVVNTPIIDAGVVYGNDRKFLKKTLRQPRSCMLRTSDGDMLPISTAPNHAGKHVFIAGDNRVDEHAVLTMMHTVWMREHNRLCEHMNYDPEFKHMTNNQKFRRARNVRPVPRKPALLLPLLFPPSVSSPIACRLLSPRCRRSPCTSGCRCSASHQRT